VVMRIFLSLLLCLLLSQAKAAPFRQTCPGRGSLCQKQATAAVACSTDGFGSNSAALTVSASTSSASGVIVVPTFLQNNTGTAGTVTGVSGCSLTWNHRTGSGLLPLAYTDTVSSSGTNIDEYYAIYSSQLSACTITVSTTGTVNSQRVSYLAFTGVNTSTPFDANASLPAVNHKVDGSADFAALSVTGVSTTNSSDCAFSMLRTQGAAGTVTNPSGWTSSGSSGTATAFAYNILSSTLSSSTVAWSWATNVSSAGAFVDAIQSSR
jgi:hypothetical protein